MIREIKYLEIGDRVMLDDKPFLEMKVYQVPVLVKTFPFVGCEWINNEGKVQRDTFLSEQLSLVRTLNTIVSPHLVLLEKKLDEAFEKGTEAVSLHYHPSKSANPFQGYCFETVIIHNISKGFEGIGMHVHYLYMFHPNEILSFLGPLFFKGEGIRLQKVAPNKYAMEYLGY